MDTCSQIQKLEKALVKTSYDARTETQLALAAESGINPDHIMVRCDSLFYRAYNKDILFTEVCEDASRQAFLQVHLTRSGIADQLPEGLFYEPAPARLQPAGAAEMAIAYKQNKQKEESTRRFFQPFENDFFRQRLQVEQEENAILQDLQCGLLNDYFVAFWGLSPDIPKSLLLPLVLLLPHAHKIAGDLSLTAACLERLLQESVQIKKAPVPLTDTTPFFSQVLGAQRLGVDAVCGSRFFEDYPVLHVSIGPVQQSQVRDYLEGGNRFQFLETCYRFFMPAGTEVQTVIEVPKDKRNMQLANNSGPVLGYTSVL